MLCLGKRWWHKWKRQLLKVSEKSGFYLKQTSFTVKNTNLLHYKNIPDWLNVKWLHTLTWPVVTRSKHQWHNNKSACSLFAAPWITSLSLTGQTFEISTTGVDSYVEINQKHTCRRQYHTGGMYMYMLWSTTKLGKKKKNLKRNHNSSYDMFHKSSQFNVMTHRH